MPNPSVDEGLATTGLLVPGREAATYLRLHPRTVGRMLQSGWLPGVKVGRQWRIRRMDLEAFLSGSGESHKNTAEST